MSLPVLGKGYIYILESDTTPITTMKTATTMCTYQVPVLFKFDSTSKLPYFSLLPGYHIEPTGLKNIRVTEWGCFVLVDYEIYTEAETYDQVVREHLTKMRNYGLPSGRNGVFVDYVEEDHTAYTHHYPDFPVDLDTITKVYWNNKPDRSFKRVKAKFVWSRQYKRVVNGSSRKQWYEYVARKSKKVGHLFKSNKRKETLSYGFQLEDGKIVLRGDTGKQ